MKNKKESLYHPVVDNIRKIINDKGLAQWAAAEMAGTSSSQLSKILAGECQLSLFHLSNFATNMHMDIIDVFTYPDKYIKADASNQEETLDTIVQIKLKKKKRDQVLQMILGDSGVEILNKENI